MICYLSSYTVYREWTFVWLLLGPCLRTGVLEYWGSTVSRCSKHGGLISTQPRSIFR